MDLMQAYGGPGDGSAMGGEQLDELLEILNTGAEIRVNGSRSIGIEEFATWMSCGVPL